MRVGRRDCGRHHNPDSEEDRMVDEVNFMRNMGEAASQREVLVWRPKPPGGSKGFENPLKREDPGAMEPDPPD